MRALWASSHPGPTLVVTVLASALAVAAGLSSGRLALLALAVFAGQLSVGISNDAIDARRDRVVGRQDKPVARGDIGVGTAWVAATGCLVVALVLSAVLGGQLLLLHGVALAFAWSYNAGLKSGPLSVVPFMLSFGIFPSFATLAGPQPQVAQLWAWLAGAALGVAVHLTNVLPDLEDDARTGITGLPHRLGVRLSAVFAAAAVLLGALVVTAGPSGGVLQEVSVMSWVLCGIVVILVMAILALVSVGRSGRILFRLVMAAAMVLAAQLVLSGGALAS